MKIKVVVILGPTAVGKSDFAVEYARKHNGEVISADSRQVYKELNIGTGKITRKEMRGVPHYLLDIADPRKSYSVVKFVEDAEKAIADIHTRGKLPVICGGTGFYIQALVDGIILPNVPPDEKLRKKLARISPAQLIALLKKLDPERLRKLDPRNIRRIIRAIEIATTLGKVPKLKKSSGKYAKYAPTFIGLRMAPDILKERIKVRLDKRLAAGMVKEAKRLHAEGLSWKRMNSLGLEYRYLALYLQNKMTLEEMREKLATEIWHYARRQMTWFRKDKRIRWVMK